MAAEWSYEETLEDGQAAERHGITRRDLLKLSAATAAAVGVGYIAGSAGRAEAADGAGTNARAAAAGPTDRRGGFAVDIPGCPVATANIHSVEIEPLTVDVREMTTGLDVEYRTYAPGDAHYGKATFRSRVGQNSKELLQWLNDASEGKSVRKNIAVIVKDRAGAEARRYNLMECFPIKYDPGDYSPSSSVRVETIVVKIGHVEFA